MSGTLSDPEVAGPPGLAVADVADRLRKAYATGTTRPLKWRLEQLSGLADMLRSGADRLAEAMAQDLGKPAAESWLTDIAAVRQDIVGIGDHLGRWAAPRAVPVPWTIRPGQAEIVPEPLGVALVIGPWNYPVRCAVLPLAFALAAGNAAALKPSELAPMTSAALAEMVTVNLDGEAVQVVQGGPEVAQQLLAQRWDHIFYTGSGRVGRMVMAAAALHLTPVTLELGGKNPAIVTEKAHVDTAAQRVAWGKFLNAGQTCAAPDFVLVDHKVEADFLKALGRHLRAFYGPDPATSGSLGRVLNRAHFDRLSRLLAATEGETVPWLGDNAPPPPVAKDEPGPQYFPPTVVRSVGWQDALMEEEVFGPILPVLSYESLSEAIDELNDRDKPLAVYVYTSDDVLANEVIARTSSGSVCVNHNAVQLAVTALPFGGVGASGMGAYHGRAGFDGASHLKAVLRKPPTGGFSLMFPPFTKAKSWALRNMLR